ncbi:class I SAM-dependent methyltransferase [Muricauda sp. CAU 1633]|uniref:class I SAM-dependent methyltransferase n=1 Tax=Allomuricauda sp. CAU 1633 TaxID=2816036 RepID=UPI001A8D87AB|nr:class I SAM-dependent methyltransferase [Muricauda sp. CAU 1633]MBO0322026.1 class I SAM-dependent methyltransferase [Muricauda sp. CAU 1633]
MKIAITVLLLGIASFLIGKWVKHKSLYPFMPFKYDFRKRRNTFLKMMELMKRTNAKLIIETGTSREGLRGAKSNGAATIVFGKWAKENNAFVHSVDINEESVKNAQAEVDRQYLQEFVQIHHSDSLIFLEDFNQKVDVLYLDSYDYSNDPEVQKKSQQHHLEEFQRIEEQLHDNSIVLIDDCDLPNGGKGKLVIAYMLEHGWKILVESYQVLLVRDDFSLNEAL